MAKNRIVRSCVVAASALVATFAAPVAQVQAAPADHGEPSAAGATEAHGVTAAELESGPQKAPPPGGWDTPNNRSYHLEASCQPYAAAIREGASAWAGLTEGGGTPVECRTSYITDCGGGTNVVGCNWGQGDRIALYMGGVNDDALLAAHEFGHDWYGHSSYQCAGWGSPAEVMAPSICNAPSAKGGPPRIATM